MLPKIKSISDRALTFETAHADEARRIADALRGEGVFQEVVPGLSSVGVFFDPLTMERDAAAARIRDRLQALLPLPKEGGYDTAPPLRISVRYGGEDGPDLSALAARLELSEEAVVARHCRADYKVAIMGFLPGFAYLEGLPEGLASDRLGTPRTRVPAGSVGIGGAFGGIYSLAGPGGWPIIGRTKSILFDPSQDEPFLLRPGRRIRFEAY